MDDLKYTEDSDADDYQEADVNYEPSSVGIQELYSMGCEPDRKDFLDKLVEFLAERNTPLIKIPTIEKAPVDLYKLYHLVKENGGVENVPKTTWKVFGPRANAAFLVRMYYIKYLHGYKRHVDEEDQIEDDFEDAICRTAFVNRFPMNATQIEIENFFSYLGYNDIECIMMRTWMLINYFKGSVYIKFRTEDGLRKFLSADDIVFNSTTLKKISKVDQLIQREEGKINRKDKKIRLRKSKKERKEKEQKLQERENAQRSMTPGAVIHLTNFSIDGSNDSPQPLGSSDHVTMATIKQHFSKFASVAWVDFEEGDSQAYVRFHEEGKAVEVVQILTAMEDLVMMDNCFFSVRVLEGDEEIEYWKEIMKARDMGRNKRRREPERKEKRRTERHK